MAILSLQGHSTLFDELQNELASLRKITKAAERERAFVDLRDKFVSAREATHSSHADLLQKVDALEKELVGLKNQEAKLRRYKLDQLPPSNWVYALKPEMADGEPLHHICATCYQNGQISHLHGDEQRNGVYHLKCNRCEKSLTIGHFRPPRTDTGRGGSWMGS